ncbi:MAG: DUF1737 domain-containing protein [Alphaproteobacteria bacterium]|nr:DUF1737 domain-containing protein [Alphaproteobacteria bacterium SS10]
MARLRYRLITGPDDDKFCERVSAALNDGYILYGQPQIAFDDGQTVCAQAVMLPDHVVDQELDEE